MPRSSKRQDPSRDTKTPDAPIPKRQDQAAAAPSLEAPSSDNMSIQRAVKESLPASLQARLEHLSGLRLDDVKVHYGSPRPGQLNARAFAQGTEIDVAPGHERHLAHEAWHVVQQKQGRVNTTRHVGGVPTNDDRGLEDEAERMGRALLEGGGASPGPLLGGRAKSEGSGRLRSSVAEHKPLQLYGDEPIPVVRNPSVVTMRDFIDLVRRIEAANPGQTALQIAQMIMRTKYHSTSWDYLLPSTAEGRGVGASGGVTAADVTTLTGEFEVTLPEGGQSDPSHIVVAIAAGAETRAPGDRGAGGWRGRLVTAIPAGVSQRDVTTWVGDVASAVAEWRTAHPHPSGGTTKQAYMDEFAPESDLIGDIDGLAMTSTSAAFGFAFDPNASLSSNLERFYYPAGTREGKNRRFHTFCQVEGLTLEPDGVTLSPMAIANIKTRVRLNAEWFEHNDPNLTTWLVLNAEGGLVDPVRDAWIARAQDGEWFARKFIEFVQRNLSAEGR